MTDLGYELIDRLMTRLLKSCYDIIDVPVQYLFNLCIMTDTYPSIWKVATITPLFKESKRNDAGKYRPIFAFSILARCLERLIHGRVYEYIHQYQLPFKLPIGVQEELLYWNLASGISRSYL